MAKFRVPSFLGKLNPEMKKEQMELYKNWKYTSCTEYLLKHLERKYQQEIEEEEKKNPLNWFQSKWGSVKSHARRQLLRDLIKDLK